MIEGVNLPVEERNEYSSLERVRSIVRYANEHAFDSDAVDLSQCLSRKRRDREREAYKTYEFLTVNRILTEDIRNVLAGITVGEYAYTSIKPGCLDAYVFGVHMPGIVDGDPEIYLKFQINDGFIVITIHEAERAMTFPYEEE